jgi:hypothetical protein
MNKEGLHSLHHALPIFKMLIQEEIYESELSSIVYKLFH